jgi:acyl-CoA thioester hydrolase
MAALLESYRGAVFPWHCDHMGHMNVMWYVGKFDEATWNLFATIGLTPAMLREQGRAMAAVQQNLSYRRELYAGDVVAVRSGFLEVRDKGLRFVHEMRNAATDEIAAVCELTAVQIDARTRKAGALAPEVGARARELTAAYDLGRR